MSADQIRALPLPGVLAITDPGRLTDPEYIAAYVDQLISEAPTAAEAHFPGDDLDGRACRAAFHRAWLEQGMRTLAESIRESISTTQR